MIKNISARKTQLAITVYPGVGYPAGDDWRISVSGIAWRTPVILNRRQRMMIRMLGNVMRATPDQLQADPFATRISPFMADAYHRLPVTIRIGDQRFPLQKKTKRNGRFEETLLVPGSLVAENLEGGQHCRFAVIADRYNEILAEGLIRLHPRTGVSVISDIDDTIKESQVSDKRQLLANTFLRDFRAVPGMADLYRRWNQEGIDFHYVSSSPWQLYGALQAIHSDLGFPNGTMHLRDFRLRDQLVQKLTIRRKGKASEIRKLLLAMPYREFVLIGDSGERDPKIYRKICKQFPGRIRGVFIRNMSYRPLDTERRSKLEAALPDGLCRSFETAEQLDRDASPLFAN